MLSLTITEKTDPKLLEFFPQDPFNNITILTGQVQLHLQSSYLVLESTFFADLSPSQINVDLTHLPTQAVSAVLRALYGGQLVVSSVRQLERSLMVIDFLGINDYRQNISNQLMRITSAQAIDSTVFSVELLEFCFKHKIIKKQISQLHFKHQLKSLQNPKNYLQLGKLSQAHLNQLLLGFLQAQGSKASKIINTVLENYINRKGLRPAEFLNNKEVAPLKQIWEEFHHKILFQTLPLAQTYPMNSMRTSSFLESVSERRKQSKLRLQKLITRPSFNFGPISQQRGQDTVLKSSEEKLLDLRISVLQAKNKQRNQKVKTLQEELQSLTSQPKAQVSSQNKLEDITRLENIARCQKNKRSRVLGSSRISFDSNCENSFKTLKPPCFQSSYRTPKFASRSILP